MPVGTVRSYSPRQGEIAQSWYQVDASGEVLGRLAVRIANVLMGKHKPTYVPHMDSGDFHVIPRLGDLALAGRVAAHRSYGHGVLPCYDHSTASAANRPSRRGRSLGNPACVVKSG